MEPSTPDPSKESPESDSPPGVADSQAADALSAEASPRNRWKDRLAKTLEQHPQGNQPQPGGGFRAKWRENLKYNASPAPTPPVSEPPEGHHPPRTSPAGEVSGLTAGPQATGRTAPGLARETEPVGGQNLPPGPDSPLRSALGAARPLFPGTAQPAPSPPFSPETHDAPPMPRRRLSFEAPGTPPPLAASGGTDAAPLAASHSSTGALPLAASAGPPPAAKAAAPPAAVEPEERSGFRSRWRENLKYNVPLGTTSASAGSEAGEPEFNARWRENLKYNRQSTPSESPEAAYQEAGFRAAEPPPQPLGPPEHPLSSPPAAPEHPVRGFRRRWQENLKYNLPQAKPEPIATPAPGGESPAADEPPAPRPATLQLPGGVHSPAGVEPAGGVQPHPPEAMPPTTRPALPLEPRDPKTRVGSRWRDSLKFNRPQEIEKTKPFLPLPAGADRAEADFHHENDFQTAGWLAPMPSAGEPAASEPLPSQPGSDPPAPGQPAGGSEDLLAVSPSVPPPSERVALSFQLPLAPSAPIDLPRSFVALAPAEPAPLEETPESPPAEPFGGTETSEANGASAEPVTTTTSTDETAGIAAPEPAAIRPELVDPAGDQPEAKAKADDLLSEPQAAPPHTASGEKTGAWVALAGAIAAVPAPKEQPTIPVFEETPGKWSTAKPPEKTPEPPKRQAPSTDARKTAEAKPKDRTRLDPLTRTQEMPALDPLTKTQDMRGIRIGAQPPPPKKLKKVRVTSVSTQVLAVFTRQIAVMIGAGVPIHQALSFYAESSEEKGLPEVIDDVAQRVSSGFRFSQALKAHPRIFSEVYTGLIETGESSSMLQEILEKLADLLEKQNRVRKKVISTLTYPAVLTLVSLGSVAVFIFYVLPMMVPLFHSLNMTLPWPTRMLLAFRIYAPPLFLTVGGAMAVVSLINRHVTTAGWPTVRRFWHASTLKIPVLGKVLEKIAVARVLYSLATMLESGVLITAAMQRCATVAGNLEIADRLLKAKDELIDGKSVAEALTLHEVFPRSCVQIMCLGEETSSLSDTVRYAADFYEEDIDQTLTSFAAMIEPMIMGVMGLFVGFIVLSAVLPTVQLLNNL